jgi:hypothetical protein
VNVRCQTIQEVDLSVEKDNGDLGPGLAVNRRPSATAPATPSRTV